MNYVPVGSQPRRQETIGRLDSTSGPSLSWLNLFQENASVILLSTLWRAEIATAHGVVQWSVRTTHQRRWRRRWWMNYFCHKHTQQFNDYLCRWIWFSWLTVDFSSPFIPNLYIQSEHFTYLSTLFLFHYVPVRQEKGQCGISSIELLLLQRKQYVLKIS